MPSLKLRIDRAAEALEARYRSQDFFVDAYAIVDKSTLILYVEDTCPFTEHREIEGFKVEVKRRHPRAAHRN